MRQLWRDRYKRTLLLLSIVLLFLIVNLVRLVPNTGYFYKVRAQSIAIVPYTVYLVEKAVGTNGLTVIKQFTRATRSDGSEVTVESGTFTHDRTHERIPYTRRQIILSSGVRVFVHDDFQLKSTAKFAGGNFAQWRLNHRDPRTDCLTAFNGNKVLVGTMTERILGHEQLNGFRTVKIEMPKQMHPNLKIWYSLDHGCEIVGQQAIFPDTVDEKFAYRVVSQEPDRSLFDVPKTYREVAPSELDRVSFVKYGTYESGNKLPPGLVEEWKRGDSRYYQDRP